MEMPQMNNFQREALRLEKQKVKQGKQKQEREKRDERQKQYREKRNEARIQQRHEENLQAENIRAFHERQSNWDAVRQSQKQHEENISLLKRVQNAEWVRWIVTTCIAVIALVASILSMLGVRLDLLLCLGS